MPLFLNESQAQSGLARLSANGTLDKTFKPGVIDGVTCVVVQPDGRILIGGYFANVNGIARNGIARLNADGSLDSTFNPVYNGSGQISQLKNTPDGRLLFFANSGFGSLYRLNTDGSLDPTWSFSPVVVGTYSGNPANGTLYGFDVQTDGKVVVLLYASTDPAVGSGYYLYSFVRRLNSNGTVDSTFTGSSNAIGYSSGGNNAAMTLKILPDGHIMVSDGIRIRRLTSTGIPDSTFNEQVGSPNVVAFGSDGRTWVGGMFTTWGGVPRNQLFRLNSDGTVDETYSTGAGLSYFYQMRGTGSWQPTSPSSIVPLSDGSTLVCGSFTRIDATLVAGLAKTTTQSTNGAHRPAVIAVDSPYQEVGVGNSYSVNVSASGSPPLVGSGIVSAVAQTTGATQSRRF